MKNRKRILALLLILIMCFSLLPVSAFAGEPEDEVTLEDSQDPPAPEEGDEGEICEHVPADAVSENEVEPTCTAPGSHDEVVYCELCGKELDRETVEDPATGHTPEDVEEVPPQVGVPGTKAGQKCAVCGEVLEGCEVIDALPEPEEEAEDEPERVRVEFVCEPKETQVTVYEAIRDEEDALVPVLDENGEPVVLEPEEDGAWLLLPGEYLYDAACEGYESVEKAALTVKELAEDENAQTVELTLAASRKRGDVLLGSTVVASGNCGAYGPDDDSVTWTLDGEGTLTISGTGEMSGYNSFDPVAAIQSGYAPWRNMNVKYVVIEDGVTNIGRNAFMGQAVWSVSIPNSVVEISYYAFKGCSALKNVTIPESVTEIKEEAFMSCTSLESITIPDNTRIGYQAFAGCIRLTGLTIPASATIYGYEAFSGCNSLVTAGPIGSGCDYQFGWTETIPSAAFEGCRGLTHVTIPSGVTSIGERAFKWCTRLRHLTLPEQLTSIGQSAFQYSGLKSITIPSSVQSIGMNAFNSCGDLEWICIPKTLQGIGNSAFYNCNALKDVYYTGSRAEWEALLDNVDDYWSKEILTSATIHFNSGAPDYSEFGTIINSGDDPWTIELESSFEDCVFQTSSTEYNPTLSYYLAGIARAIYKQGDMAGTLDNLGFEICRKTEYRDAVFQTLSGYSIAKKAVNDRTLVLIAIRGSVGYNWNNLLNIGDSETGTGAYPALRDDAEAVYDALVSFLGGELPMSGVTYVITGHSQGAGAANLLAVKLWNYGIQTADIYNYNFACPNVACFTSDANWNPGRRYDNIFNIGNVEDPVPLVPNITARKTLMDYLFGIPPRWGKYGRNYWFFPNEENHALVGHDMIYYLRELAYQYPITAFTTWDQVVDTIKQRYQNLSEKTIWKVLAGCCPVDMIVYNSSGSPVAGVIGNQPCYYDSTEGEVLIIIEGDEKWFYLPPNQEYEVRITATDNGIMTYRVLDYNLGDASIVGSKTYESVSLTTGKMMLGEVSGNIGVPVSRLYVLGEDETPIREVKDDGSEIPYVADPTIMPASLTIDREYLALKQDDASQQLTAINLPAEWTSYVAWSSDNVSVVKVDTAGKLTPFSVGTAWVTASLETSEGVITGRCRVDVVEAETELDPETGGPVTHFADGELTGVRLVDTKATTELYKSTYTRITVVPELRQNKTAGAATILAPDAPEGNSGVAVTGARFANDALNSLFALRVVDDRTLEIVPLEAAVMNAKAVKANYKSALIVTVDGEEYPTGTLNLTVKKSLPKVAVKAVKFNSFLVRQEQALSFSGAMVTSAVRTSGPAWVEYDEEARSVTYVGAQDAKQKSAKLNLAVRAEGWNVELPVTVTVSAAKSAPKLTLKPATLSLHPGAGDAAATAVTVKPSGWDCSVVNVMEGKKAAPDALEITTDGSRITVQEGPGIPTDGKAHTYKVTLALLREGSPTSVKATLTVKLLASKTKISLGAKAAGSIDTALLSSSSTVTVTPKGVNAGIVVIDPASNVTIYKEKSKTPSEDVTERFELSSADALRFTVRQRDGAALQSGYTYTAVIQTEVGGRTLSCRVKLPVKFSNPAKLKPSVTLKAKGTIDVIRPGSAVTVTPTVKNCCTYTPKADDLRIWRVQGKTLVNATKDFNVSVSGKAFRVTLKPGFTYNPTAYKYKVSLSATVDTVGGTAALNSAKAAMTVKMGKAKLTQSTKSVRLLKTDRYSMGTVTIRTADGSLAAIDWERTAAAFVSPKNKQKQPLFELNHLGGGEFAICYKDDRITTAKTTTVKIPVYLVGNNSAKPNATLSVKVQIA